MKIGIDNYSYHRYFNEIYPGQSTPPEQWNLSDFVNHILSLPELPLVEGLSIETCFLPNNERTIVTELSRLNIPFIFQWGHPNGFMDVSLEEASKQIVQFLELSRKFNSKLMRIVASSINYFDQPHEPQIQHALHYLDKILPLAESYDVKLALENHGDFLLPEIQTIIDKCDTPYLGAIIDTGNFIRMNEDPREAISLFSEKVYLVHAKDVAIMPGYSPNDPRRYGCVPAGKGETDFPGIFDELQEQSYEGMVLIEISRMHPHYDQRGEVEMIREGLHYLHSVRAGKRTTYATS
jgi:3-oxoisoapionate decarboxylase